MEASPLNEIHPMLETDISAISEDGEVPDASESVQVEQKQSPTVYKCDRCRFTTKYRSCLNRHKLSHMGVKYTCDTCSKSFSQKTDLVAHCRMVHDNEGCMCSICGKRFTSRKGLNDHEKYHNNDPSICCDIAGCSEKFRRIGALQSHKNSKHAGYFPFRCKNKGCNRSYASLDALKEHQRICALSGVQCPICNDVLATRSCLKDHIAGKHSHFEKKAKCGKVYKYRQSYNRHVKGCGECNKQ